MQDFFKRLFTFINPNQPPIILFLCVLFLFSTRWHTNPFVRGAYSYISTSCDKTGTSNRCLSEPITLRDFRKSSNISPFPNFKRDFASSNLDHNKSSITPTQSTSTVYHENSDDNAERRPLVLFAGEAVHDQYFSTAHGAFLSGMEQSAKIIDFYTQASVVID